jgi:hypothetical protein
LGFHEFPPEVHYKADDLKNIEETEQMSEEA